MAQVFDFFLQHLAFGHFELHAELFVHFQHSLELFQVLQLRSLQELLLGSNFLQTERQRKDKSTEKGKYGKKQAINERRQVNVPAKKPDNEGNAGENANRKERTAIPAQF